MMIMVVGGETDGDPGVHATADVGECGNYGGTIAITGVMAGDDGGHFVHGARWPQSPSVNHQ